jgi:hypothetical protein
MGAALSISLYMGTTTDRRWAGMSTSAARTAAS